VIVLSEKGSERKPETETVSPVKQTRTKVFGIGATRHKALAPYVAPTVDWGMVLLVGEKQQKRSMHGKLGDAQAVGLKKHPITRWLSAS